MGLHNESFKAELILSLSNGFAIASPVSCLAELNIWAIEIYKYTSITLLTKKRYQTFAWKIVALCQIADRSSNLATSSENRIFVTLTQL